MTLGSAGRFRLNLDWDSDQALVAVHGVLDVRAITELSERLSEIVAVARPRRLVVDLTSVSYVGQAADSPPDMPFPRAQNG